MQCKHFNNNNYYYNFHYYLKIDEMLLLNCVTHHLNSQMRQIILYSLHFHKESLYFFYTCGKCTCKLKASTTSDDVRVHIVNSVCRCYGTHFHFRIGQGESVRQGDCPCVAIVIKMPRNLAVLHSNFCVPDHTDKETLSWEIRDKIIPFIKSYLW